jgi:hypothetical protein
MFKKLFLLGLIGLAAWVAVKLPRVLTVKQKFETKDRMKVLLMAYDVYWSPTQSLGSDAGNSTIVTELRRRGILKPGAGEMNEKGEWLDAWRTPFRVQVIKDRCVIDSAGPDRIFGTSDDLKTRRE